MKILLPFLTLFIFSFSAFPQRGYYISPNGDDANSGTRQQPWQSLNHSGLAQLQPGDSVLLERSGIFRQTLLITASGTPALPIYIGAYGSGDAPVISGAEEISSAAWTRDSVNGTEVFKTPFPTFPAFVYINASRYHNARLPDNNNYFYISQLNYGGATQVCPGVTFATFLQDGTFRSDTLATLPFQDFTGSWLSLRTDGWEVATRTIAAYNAGLVTLDLPSYAWNPSLQFKQNYGFILSGKKNYLSVPYEFYFDSIAQQLYVVSPTGIPPQAFEYSAFDYGISFYADGMHDVILDGIALEKQKIGGILLPKYGSRITIKNCVFRNHPFGIHSLLELDADCSVRKKEVDSVTVMNNSFTDMLRGAVDLNLTHSIVEGNSIRRVGIWMNEAEWLNQYQSPYEYSINGGGTAINVGLGTAVERNTIDSCGHYGIVLGDSSVARNNIVKNTCLNYKDCGAIYVVYHSPALVENNIVDGVKGNDLGTPEACDCGNGIYLDFNGDITQNQITVRGNTIMNAATGIGILTTSNSAIGNNSISPPMTITGNTIYASREKFLGIGTIVVKVGTPDYGAPIQLTGNTVAQFTQRSGLMWWSEQYSSRADYGVAEGNHYISPYYVLNFNRSSNHDNNLLTPVRYDYSDFSDWQTAGNDTGGTFYQPYYDNYKIVNYTTQGNLLRNAAFDSGITYWNSNFYGGIFCINNTPLALDNNSPLGGSGLKYQNPFAGGCNGIQAFVSSALYDSSAASATVNLDSTAYYELSFDMASSAEKTVNVNVQYTNAINLFTKLIKSKAQPQHFTFYFQPARTAATGFLSFNIPDAPNGFSLWLDNIVLRAANVCMIPDTQMFPIVVNATADTQTLAFTEPMLDLNDDTVVTSVTLAPFTSEILAMTGLAVAGILPDTSVTLCYGEDILLNSPSNPAYTYRWFQDGNELPGETQPQLEVEQSGNYQLVVGRNDCFAGNTDTSEITSVVVLSELEITLSPDSAMVGDTLIANMGGLEYEWLLNGTPLAGANDSFLITADSGLYTVVATDVFDCSDSASTRVVAPIVNGVTRVPLPHFEVFPNPNTGDFFIRCTAENLVALELTDSKGKLFCTKWLPPSADGKMLMDCSGIAPGIYYLYVKTAAGTAFRKVCVMR